MAELSTVWLLAACAALGQVERLPPVDLVQPTDAVRPVAYPGEVSQPLKGPATAAVVTPPIHPPPPDQPPSDIRPGMFQKLIFDYGYLPRTGRNGLGINDLEGKLVLAVPCPTKDSPLLIVPGYAIHYLDGPANAEMPPRLHDAYCQFRWLCQATPRWGFDISFSPGVFSDFEQSQSAAIRYNAYAAAAYTWTECVKLVLGVGYFDRLSVNWLPIGGLIWTPNPDVNFELLFPRPRLARRFYGFGAEGPLVQDWAYLAAEFGGGAWAFARSDGVPDVLDFRDYRIYFGLERKVIGGLDGRLEIGYVFGRKVQYQSHLPPVYPNDTVMIRGGLVY